MSDTYCSHLASILRKAQGVFNAEQRERIDVGHECMRLREICDALRAERDAALSREAAAMADAERWRFYANNHYSIIECTRLRDWLTARVLRYGSMNAAIDAAIAATHPETGEAKP